MRPVHCIMYWHHVERNRKVDAHSSVVVSDLAHACRPANLGVRRGAAATMLELVIRCPANAGLLAEQPDALAAVYSQYLPTAGDYSIQVCAWSQRWCVRMQQ